jgi:acetyl/propionyl-CoA carboxylase alpha subunit
VIEESPSPAVSARLRKQLGEAALRLAREAGYVGAGTVEFLLAPGGDFYFLELNARLQVEHPVTEMVTGRDLVADQLRIAEGAPLGFSQSDVHMDGHAVEARLYAEDARCDFLPATGYVFGVTWPRGEGVRLDAGVGESDVIGVRYDPLLAKLIVSGAARRDALMRLGRALDETSVLGVTTNRGFLGWLVRHPDVVKGATFTRLIDERWHASPDLTDADWSAVAAVLAQAAGGEVQLVGFRLNARPRLRVQIGDEVRSVEVPADPRALRWVKPGPHFVFVDLDGQSIEARLAPAPTIEAAVRLAGHHGASAERITAPMPGNVLGVRVVAGDEVEAGQVLVVLEAMKMENNVAAPAAGRVAQVLVIPGQQVQRGETLVELA